MKHLMIIAILASFFSFSAFAEGQTDTECPMIKLEQQRRSLENNKLKDAKKQVRSKSSTGVEG